jgi:pimeloyl-ACP methyl ester carboxylesterase
LAVGLTRTEPALFDRLVLVCPTGIARRASSAGWIASSAFRWMLRIPVVGASVYNLLTSQHAIRIFLMRRSVADPSHVTNAMVAAHHQAAHQPGSDHVLATLVGAEAFASEADFAGLRSPGPLLICGRAAHPSAIAEVEALLQVNRRAIVRWVDRAGMLPHEEKAEETLAFIREYLTMAPGVA